MTASCDQQLPSVSLSLTVLLILIEIIQNIFIFVGVSFIFQADSTFSDKVLSNFSSETFMGSCPLSSLSNLSIKTETQRNWSSKYLVHFNTRFYKTYIQI